MFHSAALSFVIFSLAIPHDGRLSTDPWQPLDRVLVNCFYRSCRERLAAHKHRQRRKWRVMYGSQKPKSKSNNGSLSNSADGAGTDDEEAGPPAAYTTRSGRSVGR